MVFQTASHVVSSHETRDPECFADSSNIPWNPPTIRCPELIDCPDPICVALTYNDSRIVLPRIRQILKNIQCKSLLASSAAPGTSLGSSGSPEKILFYTGTTVSTVLPNLVPQRRIDDCCAIHTSFMENIVIRSYQITNIFRSGHDCTSTSSARSSRYFCLEADIAIRVRRKVRVGTKLTRTRFHLCSPLHW